MTFYTSVQSSARRLLSMIQIRYVVIVLVAMATGVDYLGRQNINVAIVSMAHESEGNVPLSKCPGAIVRVNRTLHEDDGRKNWDPKMQGIILGSFYYSYVFMQIPSGRLAEVYGAKWIIAISLMGTAIVNVLTPLMSDSVAALTISRIALGFAQGGLFPACFALIPKWFPLKERSVAFTFTELGSTLGAMVGNTLTGYLSEHGESNKNKHKFITLLLIQVLPAVGLPCFMCRLSCALGHFSFSLH